MDFQIVLIHIKLIHILLVNIALVKSVIKYVIRLAVHDPERLRVLLRGHRQHLLNWNWLIGVVGKVAVVLYCNLICF